MTDPVEGNDASYLFPKQHILGSNPLPGSALSPSCLIPDIAFALSDLVLPEHGYRNYPAGTLKVVVKREIAPLFPMAKRAAINSSGDERGRVYEVELSLKFHPVRGGLRTRKRRGEERVHLGGGNIAVCLSVCWPEFGFLNLCQPFRIILEISIP